jgi:two-component system sensor histidine kinase UhpB
MLSTFDIRTVLIFFVYGLAFFTMGLAMSLESRRSPLLAEARLLYPLAFFGFVHGTHEWLEMYLRIQEWFDMPVSEVAPWLRLFLLVVSFTSLIFFGLQTFLPVSHPHYKHQMAASAAFLLIYALAAVLVGISHQHQLTYWLEDADALARYLLAAPGAGLAALALHRQARQTTIQRERSRLVQSLNLAALCFGLYALTQSIVAQSDLLPAQLINQETFTRWTGVPVQAVRAVLAIFITVSLMRASQVVEDERRWQFEASHRERVEAMEQAQRDLEEKETLRRELLQRTVMAQEEERTRIARELHDETAQFLTALTLNLAALEDKLGRNPAGRAILEQIIALSREMSHGIHRMIRDLRPAQLDNLGLVAALQYLADDASQRANLQVDLQLQGVRRRLDSVVETVFFRIAQEALTNISRHAQTSQAWIYLVFEPQQVTLRVIDQGNGFEPEKIGPKSRWGLTGIAERAMAVGGSLRLESAPGHGTMVEVIIPTLVAIQESSLEV